MHAELYGPKQLRNTLDLIQDETLGQRGHKTPSGHPARRLWPPNRQR